MRKFIFAFCALACTMTASAQKTVAEDADYIRPSMYSIMLDITPKKHAPAYALIKSSYNKMPINHQYNDWCLPTRHIDANKLPACTKAEADVYGKESAAKKFGKNIVANTSDMTGANVNDGPTDYEYIARLMKWFAADNTAKKLIAKWYNAKNAPLTSFNWDPNEENFVEYGLKGLNTEEKATAVSNGRTVGSLLNSAADELTKTTYITVTRYNYYTADELIATAGELAKAGADKGVNKLGGSLGGFGGLAKAGAQAGIEAATAAAKKKYSGNYVQAITYLFQVQAPTYEAMYDKYGKDASKFMSDPDIKIVYVGKSTSGYRKAGKAEKDSEPVARATKNAVNATYVSLQKEYEQFCPMSSLHVINGNLGAYIGTEEGLTEKSKFNVYEMSCKDNKMAYTKIGSLKVAKGGLYNNSVDDDPDQKVEGDKSRTYTQFEGKPSNKANEGMLIKMGK